MAKILVFGATGQVGGFLLPRLLATGHEVWAVSRRAQADGVTGLHWLCGDLENGVPPVPPVDAIVSLGPLDRFAAWFDAQADGSRVTRVVALGSMSASTKRDAPDATERALAAVLLAAEQRLIGAARRSGCACCVLRPTLIYGGAGSSLARFARFARRTRLFPWAPGARGLRQPVHADDLALACANLIDRSDGIDDIINIGGGERLTHARMLQCIRRRMEVFSVPVPLPLAMLRLAAALTGRGRGVVSRLGEDLVVDNVLAEQALAIRPRRFEP